MPRLIKLVKVYMEYLEQFRAISMAKHERQVAALREHEEILRVWSIGIHKKLKWLLKDTCKVL